ncbi:MAG: hypothetical protein K0S07_1481 [Chlamydiales bacterium]|jgi:DNA polymerase-3 subunit epsilon|nr:hypothetical protein [Chlamydiales bacterium]
MALRAIYYDTETTGINPEKERIIEIACFDPVLNKSFVSLIKPGIPIPKEATAVHGITDEMCQDQPSFKEVSEELIQFCEGDVVLIAHNNIAFDLPFLKAEFARNQLEMPAWKQLDSLKWARKYRPDLPRHSLQILREIYGIPPNQAHRALDDVIVLYQIFSTMIGDLDMETVMSLLEKPEVIHNMPFGKHQGKPLKDLPKDYAEWLQSSGTLDKPGNQSLKEALKRLSLA